MITGIESKLYRVYRSYDYTEEAYIVEIKDLGSNIVVFKDELNELIQLLTKTEEIL